MDFKRINSITGWLVFIIASATYLMTIEPTASFWDCGEFISTAYKLEVGHPPGAPFFMLVARLFTLLAGSNVELVAKMVNSFSALCSGFTILLLFWSITHLGRKLTGKSIGELSATQTVSIIGSGVVGALAYTFSDTFWFSAVEGEVYAFSSLFTALVFWAILRWEDEADARYANRWLVLIAYLMGLSIGVHLLNLLAIPAIGLVIYHRKYKVTPKGTILALLASAVVLLVILYGIVPGVVQIAVWFELLLVKNLHFPMNTGIIVYAILLVGGFIFGLHYSLKKNRFVLNSALLFAVVIIIGYSSYAALIIRSSVDPPMDQNNPQNLFNLQYYLNREQYGDRPLVMGPYFNSPPIAIKDVKTLYAKRNNQYVETGKKQDYVYRNGTTTVFPRMYSREQAHVDAYKRWANIPATQGDNKIPSFGQNLRFFFSYQVGWMYFRYFFWNFIGRQNDIQGHGGPLQGNWISGITGWDEARLGPQDLPETLHNKGRNVYYCLPFLLGFIGLLYQYRRDRKNFLVTLMLFFMTGIAIVIYLNQTPYQPRERDYAYAGSFYAFAIWIGLGVMAMIESLPSKMRNVALAVATSLVLLVLVPGIMAQQNWDDHDRSGRYTARDFAHNYLVSCDPNSIIFTNGDNDTFPLWYAQEVEGIGDSIRVVNLSYLAADWYIDQMTRKAYGSKSLPISLKPEQYMSGTRDYLYISDLFNGQPIELKEAMDFVGDDNIRTKVVQTQDGLLWTGKINEINKIYLDQAIDFLPSKNLKITVDKQKVLRNGTVALKDSALIVPEIRWNISGEKGGGEERIYKNSMMVLDILANNNWERPVYFAITVSPENFLNLSDYFQMDGLAYRFVPIKTPNTYGEMGHVDADKLYDKMINHFRWGNISDSSVYLDETNLRLLARFRSNFARLARNLNEQGKIDSAMFVLNKAFEVIPTYQLPLNYADIEFVQQYYLAGATEEGNQLAKKLFDVTCAELKYYLSFPKEFKNDRDLDNEQRFRVSTISMLQQFADGYNQTEMAEEFTQKLHELFPQIQ
ncbi:MAG: DUF2723 domain-containing protein [Bacteroidales bacterium]|jgi:hypothetical protein|nr:DUF2723 domain-containing protein [Bacteroidales bacterium]